VPLPEAVDAQWGCSLLRLTLWIHQQKVAFFSLHWRTSELKLAEISQPLCEHASLLAPNLRLRTDLTSHPLNNKNTDIFRENKTVSVPPDYLITATLTTQFSPPLSGQNQRRPRQVLDGSQDGAQLVPPVSVHPAPLGLHASDRSAAPSQEDPRISHLQKHPWTP